MIYDHVSKKKEKVDNLPIGFIIPVALIEIVGDSFTTLFEQSFATKFNYTSYGPNFGSSLIQEMKNVKLQDPILSMNMETFLERCVLSTAAIGIDFTFDDLLRANDIWDSIIKTKMKDGIREVQILDSNGSRSQMGCKSAATQIEKNVNSEVNEIFTSFRSSNFGLAGGSNYFERSVENPNINKYFARNLRDVFSNYLGQNLSATQIMRQLLMMNSFSKYGNYGTLRAIQSQETSWQITGRLASYYLPMLLTVMKCLMYGMFIFVAPAMVLSGSFHHYKAYLVFLASFQLWPGLSAILNMFVDLYSASVFKDISGAAVSLASFSKVGDVADKIVGIAAMLQMSVPFLALQAVRGSFEVVGNMAAQLQSSVASSSSFAASELNSGNRNFDNVQMNNVSGFKTDLNSSYRADSSEMQQASGALIKTTAQGQSFSVSGAGIDKTQADFKYSLRSASESQISDALHRQDSLVNNLSNSLNTSKAKTIDQAAEMLSSIDDYISKGGSTSFAKQISEDKDLAEITAKAHELQKAHNITKEEAFRGAVQAHGELGKSGVLGIAGKLAKFVGNVVGISGGISGSIEKSGSSSSTGTIGSHDTSSKSNNSTKHLGLSDQANQEENISKSLGVNKQQLERFNRSISETTALENKTSSERSKLQSLEHSLQQVRSSGGSYEKDVTDEVIAGTAKEMGISKHEAVTRIANNDWTATGVASRVHGKLQTQHDRRSGISTNLPSETSFAANIANQQKAAADSYKGTLDSNNQIDQGINQISSNIQSSSNTLLRDKENMESSFAGRHQNANTKIDSQQQAIQTAIDKDQSFYQNNKNKSNLRRLVTESSQTFVKDSSDKQEQQEAESHVLDQELLSRIKRF